MVVTLESEQANRTRIDEPKTPFHYLEEDGEAPQAFPPPARAARPAEEQAPGYHERQLQAGMHDLGAITAAALAKREEPEPEDDVTSACRRHHHTHGVSCPSHVLSRACSQAEVRGPPPSAL